MRILHKKNKLMLSIAVSVSVTLIFTFTPTMLTARATNQKAAASSYPYSGEKFQRLVVESYQWGNAGNSQEFYKWMNSRFMRMSPKATRLSPTSITQMIGLEKSKLAKISNTSARAKAEQVLAANLHSLIKKMIPRFSLDRGFEFYNTAHLGERQCFLQSVLISGLLQQAGMDSGIAMVYKNETGGISNNGHAITLVKLADGHDIIVDASEAKPFARHQGLFVASKGYKYVEPIYQKNSAEIQGYRTAMNGSNMRATAVRGLDYEFIRSQFYYYRGERAVGGILATRRTANGLEISKKAFLKSVQICPENPLAVYMLGRTYYQGGNYKSGAVKFESAQKLYSSFGWVPSGLKEYLAITRGNDQKNGKS